MRAKMPKSARNRRRYLLYETAGGPLREEELSANLKRAALALYGAVGASELELTVIVRKARPTTFLLGVDSVHVPEAAAAVAYSFALKGEELPILLAISGTIRSAVERSLREADAKNSKSPSHPVGR